MILDPLTLPETRKKIVGYEKIYPNFVISIIYNHDFYAQTKYLEPTTPKKPIVPITKVRSSSTIPTDSRSRTLRRSKTRIKDLILCNDFDLFVTFTFAKNRNDISKCKKTLTDFLNSQQKKQNKKFQYILVPEFHKDKKAIHFHGLFKNFKPKLTDSTKKTKKGQTIYNIKAYRSGFSTAIYTDGSPKLASYVTKYITKDLITEKNKKAYWCSMGLKRPIINTLSTGINLVFPTVEKVYQAERFTIYKQDVTILNSNNNQENSKWQKPKNRTLMELLTKHT